MKTFTATPHMKTADILLKVDGEIECIDCYFSEMSGQWYAHLGDFTGVGDTARDAAIDARSEAYLAGAI
jgi:hypothetical protein